MLLPELIDNEPSSNISLIWDPDVISEEEYIALVTTLGDLARAAGAEGIERGHVDFVSTDPSGAPPATGGGSRRDIEKDAQ